MLKINPSFIHKSVKDRLYHMPVPVIGLTGGIASGKSTVAKLLQDSGIKLIDADRLVKGVYQIPRIQDEIRKLVPSAVSNQHIDFKVLREVFFNQPELASKIEHLIYAELPVAFQQAYQHDVQSHQDFIIYDVPLLFEKGLYQVVDYSICVWCEEETQIKRLVERDHIDIELAKKILAKQWPINKKRDQSDRVLMNNSSLNELKNQVSKFVSDLLL